MSRYLTDLADILRDAGLEVVELAGWKTRAATLGGKPGPFDPKGILCHHTAGSGDGKGFAEWMATGGYPPTLYPPLAQLGLDRAGVWYVQAAGRANHAGRCRPIAGLQALPGQSYGDGNTQLLGVEAMNTGSEGWTPTQYGSYVRGVAAIKAAYAWDIVLGHKETSLEGKVDPDFSMDQFRADVAAGNYQEDPLMGMTIKLTEYQQNVMGTKADEWPVEKLLGYIAGQAAASRKESVTAVRLLEAQAAKGEILTPEEVAAIASAVADEMSDDFEVTGDVRLAPKAPAGS